MSGVRQLQQCIVEVLMAAALQPDLSIEHRRTLELPHCTNAQLRMVRNINACHALLTHNRSTTVLLRRYSKVVTTTPQVQ